MKHRLTLTIATLAFTVCAGGAGGQNPSSMTPATPVPTKSCTTCGTIESIRYVEEKGQGSGAGAVVGGVLGGVVGHQFGSGRGNTVATVAGVGVGAVAGNEVEKNAKKKSYYVVTVRLDNGNQQSISQGAKPAMKAGDRVKIVDGNKLALLAN
jgi:outer membrane lipoprotein SlyB